jgi:uncharacterized spore protein YtfJ
MPPQLGVLVGMPVDHGEVLMPVEISTRGCPAGGGKGKVFVIFICIFPESNDVAPG